jgi:hypothetical protein
MAEPQWTTVMKDIVTSAAVILGGGWAAWKWGYGETLRRRREMPSPDGTLTATSVRLNDETAAVTLNAIWRNRGPLPIELCAKHTVVEAFILNESLPIGHLVLIPGEKIESVSVVKPTWDLYVLEPNTDSAMTEHFTLNHNYTHGFRWTICLGQSVSHFTCSRELLWKSDIQTVST